MTPVDPPRKSIGQRVFGPRPVKFVIEYKTSNHLKIKRSHLNRLLFVDTGPEIVRVTSECDSEQFQKSIHAVQ
jgi:hypothetical protein